MLSAFPLCLPFLPSPLFSSLFAFLIAPVYPHVFLSLWMLVIISRFKACAIATHPFVCAHRQAQQALLVDIISCGRRVFTLGTLACGGDHHITDSSDFQSGYL
ncbi:MAG: hypothetical protein ACR5K7_02855 [Symbiopectobacterium sp.]